MSEESWQLPEWSKRDDLGGLVPSEIRRALGDAYRAGRAEATKQQPLTEARLDELFRFSVDGQAKHATKPAKSFARAIEYEHGILPPTKEPT